MSRRRSPVKMRTHSVFRGPPVGTRLRRGLYGQTAGDFAFCSEGEVLWEKTDVLQEGTAFCIANGPPVGTRLRRGLHGQTAGDFAFSLGRENPVKAGGHTVSFADLRSGRAYGEVYMGRRLGILLSRLEGKIL